MAYGADNNIGSYSACDNTTLDGPDTTDLSCNAGEIVYEDACFESATALACYQDLDSLRGDASSLTKFTRASSVE